MQIDYNTFEMIAKRKQVWKIKIQPSLLVVEAIKIFKKFQQNIFNEHKVLYYLSLDHKKYTHKRVWFQSVVVDDVGDEIPLIPMISKVEESIQTPPPESGC